MRPAARRALNTLPRADAVRIDERILGLMENPRSRDAIKLKGIRETYRIRVGDYRVLYQVQDDLPRVIIVDIGHRREIYR